MIAPLQLIAACAAVTFKEPPKLKSWEWLDNHAHIPAVTGASEPGPLDTSRVPPMRGLYELLSDRKTRFFTLAKSARVGGTLFAICSLLHKIGTSGGPILWVDPSRASARQLFRRELEPFLLACPPVASQAIRDKQHWTASQVFFRGGSFIKIAGAGSPNELAGFQAETIVINEGDKIHHGTKGEAPAHELAVVRSKQFQYTRRIIENSTPTDESGPTWRNFLKGTQHHAYLPCPHCGHMQRLTFFPEEKEVGFSEDLQPLPAGQTRTEKTGRFKFDGARITEERETEPGKWEKVNVGWDYDAAESCTVYECAKGCEIDQSRLNWMLRRYVWMQHNRKAPRSHVSAHFWAAYSPFESWGAIAKKYLMAIGDAGAMHDFYNSDLGLPFRAIATEVDESDIEKMQKASPRYILRTMPGGKAAGGWRPEYLTMTVDVQKQTGNNPFWWVVMAWGVAWDLPGWPTVGVLVDYGPAVNWSQIEEIAGINPDPRGQFNEYTWRNPDTGEEAKFRVFSGLVDSGDQAQSEAEVYEFCVRNVEVFQPSKGGSRAHLRGERMRLSEVYDKRLQLVWYWSDVFAQTLYRRIIKDRKEPRWMPQDLGPEFIDQLTDEHTEFKNGRLIWVARRKNNHLGDGMKMQEVLRGSIEQLLDVSRVKRAAELEAAGEADAIAA